MKTANGAAADDLRVPHKSGLGGSEARKTNMRSIAKDSGSIH